MADFFSRFRLKSIMKIASRVSGFTTALEELEIVDDKVILLSRPLERNGGKRAR